MSIQACIQDVMNVDMGWRKSCTHYCRHEQDIVHTLIKVNKALCTCFMYTCILHYTHACKHGQNIVDMLVNMGKTLQICL